jgi:predicted transcriptional regulator
MIETFRQLVATLERLGFRKREAEIYLGLLSSPGGTVVDLAEALGMPRSSLYDGLAQLVDKGFVEELENTGDTHRFIPTSPERILEILKAQQAVLAERVVDAETILPNLLALHGAISQSFKVRFYSGQTAFLKIRQDFEKLTADIWQIVNYDSYISLGNSYSSSQHQSSLSKNPRRIRSIVLTDHPKALPAMPGLETITLPTALAPMEGELTVCGDRVAFFAYSGEVMALDVHSPAIAGACRAALTLAWQSATTLAPTL